MKTLFSAGAPRADFRQTARRALGTPVFAPLMAQRVLARAIVGAAAAHLALSALGVSVWHCPVREVTGVPCPGCGLTRAIMLLLRGDFYGALKMHAYAPLLLVALLLLFGAAVLPREYSQRFTKFVAHLESRTGIGAVLLALLPIYWIARLIFHAAPL